MDYIGIQAYFPLTKNKNPNLAEIKAGWSPHFSMLQALSEKHKKPILFTEVGYKSQSNTTIEPWKWKSFLDPLLHKKSFTSQRRAYEALFDTFWKQEWFAGIYIWQWDARSSEEKAKYNHDFSPRYKPAQNVIAKWYGKEN